MPDLRLDRTAQRIRGGNGDQLAAEGPGQGRGRALAAVRHRGQAALNGGVDPVDSPGEAVAAVGALIDSLNESGAQTTTGCSRADMA